MAIDSEFSHWKQWVSIDISNYQRVNLHFPMVFLWFSYGFAVKLMWEVTQTYSDHAGHVNGYPDLSTKKATNESYLGFKDAPDMYIYIYNMCIFIYIYIYIHTYIALLSVMCLYFWYRFGASSGSKRVQIWRLRLDHHQEPQLISGSPAGMQDTPLA